MNKKNITTKKLFIIRKYNNSTNDNDNDNNNNKLYDCKMRQKYREREEIKSICTHTYIYKFRKKSLGYFIILFIFNPK